MWFPALLDCLDENSDEPIFPVVILFLFIPLCLLLASIILLGKAGVPYGWSTIDGQKVYFFGGIPPKRKMEKWGGVWVGSTKNNTVYAPTQALMTEMIHGDLGTWIHGKVYDYRSLRIRAIEDIMDVRGKRLSA